MNELRRRASDLSGAPRFLDWVQQNYPALELPSLEAQRLYVLLLFGIAFLLLACIYAEGIWKAMVKVDARLLWAALKGQLITLGLSVFFLLLQGGLLASKGYLDFSFLKVLLRVAVEVAAGVLLLALVLAILDCFVQPPTDISRFAGGLEAVGKILSVILLFPLVEEVIFRWFLYTGQ